MFSIKIKNLCAAALFCAALAPATSFAQAEASWSGVERIVVIGDLHGDYAGFSQMLTQAGLVDADGDWAGGETHLVQLGDVPDRGDDTRMILDHLMRLERQAPRAGGHVHALIGNHEAMNIFGDLEYASPAEFAAFAGRGSERLRERYYRRVVDHLRNNPPAEGRVTIDDAFRAEWEREHPLGWVEHRAAWSPAEGDYGRWVASNDAIIRINDILFVHGGVGPSYAGDGRDELNDAVRAALRAPLQEMARAEILWSEDSPLWYRGFAHNPEPEEASHLEAVLDRHGVARVIVGHTPVAAAIVPRFNGRVVLADPWEPPDSPATNAFLIIENGEMTVMHRGGAVDFEPQTPEGVAAYYDAVIALDPQPSPLAPFLAELNAAPEEAP